MMDLTYGETLRVVRIRKGFSQGGLAKALGVSQQAVCKWETDRNMPDPDAQQKIATLLGIRVQVTIIVEGDT